MENGEIPALRHSFYLFHAAPKASWCLMQSRVTCRSVRSPASSGNASRMEWWPQSLLSATELGSSSCPSQLHPTCSTNCSASVIRVVLQVIILCIIQQESTAFTGLLALHCLKRHSSVPWEPAAPLQSNKQIFLFSSLLPFWAPQEGTFKENRNGGATIKMQYILYFYAIYLVTQSQNQRWPRLIRVPCTGSSWERQIIFP